MNKIMEVSLALKRRNTFAYLILLKKEKALLLFAHENLHKHISIQIHYL